LKLNNWSISQTINQNCLSGKTTLLYNQWSVLVLTYAQLTQQTRQTQRNDAFYPCVLVAASATFVALAS